MTAVQKIAILRRRIRVLVDRIYTPVDGGPHCDGAIAAREDAKIDQQRRAERRRLTR